MSSAEVPITKDIAAATGPYVARNFFRQLLSFLAVDIVVMFCFDGVLWQWAVLTGVEAVFLILNLWRSSVSVRKVLEPVSTLTEAAQSVKDSALDANDLRRLARRLELGLAGAACLTTFARDLVPRVEAVLDSGTGWQGIFPILG